MPRGVKGSGTPAKPRKTTDQKIKSIDASIAKLKEQIADLNMKRKSLLEVKELEQKSELLKVIDQSGMTTDELLALVKSKK